MLIITEVIHSLLGIKFFSTYIHQQIPHCILFNWKKSFHRLHINWSLLEPHFLWTAKKKMMCNGRKAERALHERLLEQWFLIEGKIILCADTKCIFTFQVQHMTDETIALYGCCKRYHSFYHLFFTAHVKWAVSFQLLLRLYL